MTVSSDSLGHAARTESRQWLRQQLSADSVLAQLTEMDRHVVQRSRETESKRSVVAFGAYVAKILAAKSAKRPVTA